MRNSKSEIIIAFGLSNGDNKQMNKNDCLRQYFGYNEFREGQAQLMDALISGRDCLGVMPTGSGKSVCYQVPAMMLSGITLVVSPLISLMRDQVLSLVQAGIPAAFLNSSLTLSQYRLAMHRAVEGRYKIIYIAPERLLTNDFLAFAKNAPISLIAVDEAHCVSQWGHDFRPSYLLIADFLNELTYRPPLGAFTATATRNVKADIIKLLHLQDPLSITTGFNRENLFFSVVQPKDKGAYIVHELKNRSEKSGIVYCSTRKTVETLCETLNGCGLRATRYHAGLSDEERAENQEDFVYDRKNIMVATNAFGMGIDKSNVSFVFHYNMPKDLESYYQEAGRAGRDGESADCVLMFSPKDISTNKYLIMHNRDNGVLSEKEQNTQIRRELQRLDTMIGYAQTTGCLRKYILNYFDEPHPGKCESCGNCTSESTQVDITNIAKIALSCVEAVNNHCGYGFGASFYVRILYGSRDKRILDMGFDALPCYGALTEYTRNMIKSVLNHLIAIGYVKTTKDVYSTLYVNREAINSIEDGQAVVMTVNNSKQNGYTDIYRHNEYDSYRQEADPELLDALRRIRSDIAKREGVPAYIVFTNHTLTQLAILKPGNRSELLNVPGMGMSRASKYGERLLAEIKKFTEG